MPSPKGFFNQARAHFAEAAGRVPDGDVNFLLARHHLRLRFAGTALRPVVEPVFRHLPPAPAGVAELTIDLWDARTTGVGLPPRPWRADDHGARGFVQRFCDARFATRLDARSAALSMIDGVRGLAFQWVPDAARLPHWERAHPLSTVLGHWFHRHGLPMIHAAAIGRPGGGALVVGRGGSGKSTCVLACIAAGLQTAGDDYLLIDIDAATAYSLFGSATLHAHHRRRFPQLMPEAEDAAAIDDKCIALLSLRRPAAMTDELPLVAIIVPGVIGDGPCRSRPISAAWALRALAPSTLLQLGLGDAAALGRLAALCRRLPCFALDLGVATEEIPAAICEILDRCADRPAAVAGAT